MKNTINYEHFCGTYKPIKNYFDTNALFNGRMYGISGKDLDYIRNTQTHKIWTLVESAKNHPVIVPGYRFANRVGYFITVKPWDDEDSELIVTIAE